MEILIELKQRNAKLSKDKETIEQKVKILEKFSTTEIEDFLMNSKNEISSVVSCFFTSSGGLLTELETCVSQTPKRAYLDLKLLISKHKNIQ